MSSSRPAFLIALVLAIAGSAPAVAVPTPRGAPVPVSCSGPAAAEGRAVAKAQNLKLGQDPKACFGRMQIYDGPDHQIVVVAPTERCPGGKAMDIYGRSRAGPWYSFFSTPICGSTVSIGPKNRWGDWMLTIDGAHYDSRGEFYAPVD